MMVKFLVERDGSKRKILEGEPVSLISEPPSTPGYHYVVLCKDGWDDHAAPRDFKLRDGVWLCEHLAYDGGFDCWDEMVKRGWRRVEVA